MVDENKLQLVVELAKQGDLQAFEELYNLTVKFTFFHAKSIFKDEGKAWDLVQDTYIVVYQKIGTLRENNKVKSWIGGIVFNLGHKLLSKNAEFLLSEKEEFLFENLEDNDKDISPDKALDAKETTKIIQETIDNLPELQKSAVIAYYFDEKNITTIAEEAMCSEGTIKSRLNYARKAMKESIEQKERHMGVKLHTVTGPIIILALRNLFILSEVSEEHVTDILRALLENIRALEITGLEQNLESSEMQIESSSAIDKGVLKAGKTSTMLFNSIKVKFISGSIFLALAGILIAVTMTVPSIKKVNNEATDNTIIPTTIESNRTFPEKEEPEPGWIKVGDNWKYMEEGGIYLSHKWKEIDGNLYYFKKDELMANDDVYIGRQIFSFNNSGILVKISDASGNDSNNVFYDEDIKYYIKENCIYKTLINENKSETVYSLPQSISTITVENNTIYFQCEHRVCSVRIDGTDFKELATADNWKQATSIASQSGKIYFSFTDETDGDADLLTGKVYGLINDELKEQHDIEGYPPKYKKLQVSNEWVYCLHSNEDSELRGGEVHNNTVYRMANDTYERITGDQVEEYFVNGDTLYYMQSGILNKLSISETVSEQLEAKEFLKNNPQKAYENYVNNILLPQKGKFNSFHVVYGYKREEYGLQTMPASLDSGIINTCIEDLDLDGIPELVVISALQQQDGTNINLEIYHINNNDIVYYGGGILASKLFTSDLHEFRVFVKDFGDKKIIGATSKGEALIVGDGIYYEINLYQCVKESGIKEVLSLAESGSDWSNNVNWINAIRQQGFEITAKEWEDMNAEYLISQEEPRYKSLVNGYASINNGDMALEDFFSEINSSIDLSPFKVIGDIKVDN